MHKTTIAVVATVAITLSAAGVVSAMGIYDNNNKSTETDAATASEMSEECRKWMKKHGNATMDQCMQMMEDNGGSQMEQCMQMMEDNGGSQMEQCMQMMQMCTQMINGNGSGQTNSSGMGGMMNGGGMDCH